MSLATTGAAQRRKHPKHELLCVQIGLHLGSLTVSHHVQAGGIWGSGTLRGGAPYGCIKRDESPPFAWPVTNPSSECIQREGGVKPVVASTRLGPFGALQPREQASGSSPSWSWRQAAVRRLGWSALCGWMVGRAQRRAFDI